MPNLMRTGGGGGGKIEITVTSGLSKSSSRMLPSISSIGRGVGATSIGTKGIFAGGFYNSSGSVVYSDTVDVIDILLNVGQMIGSLPNKCSYPAGAAAADEAIFAGGSSANSTLKNVCAFNIATISRRNLVNLSIERPSPDSGSANGLVLFWDTSTSKPMDIINPASNTIQTISLLSPNRYRGGTVSFDDEIIMGGGNDGNGALYTNVNAINPSTKTSRSLTGLSVARYSLSACAVGDEVIFGGGMAKSNVDSDIVDVINVITNTRRTLPALSSPRSLVYATLKNAAATSGKEGIFATHTGIADAINPETNTTRLLNTPLQTKNSGGLTVNNEAVFTGNGLVEVFSSTPPNTFYIDPLELTNGLSLDSLVSVDTDCTYKSTDYIKNSVLPYDPNVTSAVARNVPAGATSVNIHHVLKKGKYIV